MKEAIITMIYAILFVIIGIYCTAFVMESLMGIGEYRYEWDNCKIKYRYEYLFPTRPVSCWLGERVDK